MIILPSLNTLLKSNPWESKKLKAEAFNKNIYIFNEYNIMGMIIFYRYSKVWLLPIIQSEGAYMNIVRICYNSNKF